MKAEQIFTSTINQKILKFLAGNPEKIYFDSEIAQKIGISAGACNQALRDLFSNNLVTKETKGRMNFYQINSDNSLTKQFKVFLIVSKLNPIIEKIKKYSQKIILFGSSSRGENTSISDIDLFILSRQKEEVEKNINNKKIKTIIKTPTEFSNLEKNDPVFFGEIERGIKIWEAKDES